MYHTNYGIKMNSGILSKNVSSTIKKQKTGRTTGGISILVLEDKIILKKNIKKHTI